MMPEAAPADATQQDTDAVAGGMASDEQCVPLDALAMPDETEQMATPAVGDTVNYQVEGKVVRIEGGNAYVQPTSVNGQAVEADEEQQPEPDEATQDANSFADLQQQAQEQGPLNG
ncbi:MAG TPA: hypothetical protein VHA37_04520 [Candidatus Saccharimonadales bacterium]|nr:hypothetical protein [Candidatus Saccharimonadales bacterium]